MSLIDGVDMTEICFGRSISHIFICLAFLQSNIFKELGKMIGQGNLTDCVVC